MSVQPPLSPPFSGLRLLADKKADLNQADGDGMTPLIAISRLRRKATAWRRASGPMEAAAEALGPLIEDPDFPKVGQNLKYEWKVLRKCLGLTLRGVECDTMLAAYLLDPGRRGFGLDQLSLDLLGHKMISFKEATEGLGADATFGSVDVEAATQYAAEDADITLRIRDELMPRIAAGGLARLNAEVEVPLAEVIGRMEQTGIRIDPSLLRAQSDEYTHRLAELSEEIHDLAEGPFNIDSPKQLGEVLFDRLGLPAEKKTKKGGRRRHITPPRGGKEESERRRTPLPPHISRILQVPGGRQQEGTNRHLTSPMTLRFRRIWLSNVLEII